MSDRNGFENPYAHVLRTGDESWVYPSWSAGRKPAISVQWLTFQGVEFQVTFETQSERDAAAKAVFEAFGPEEERAILTGDRWELAEAMGHTPYSDPFYRALSDIDERRSRASKGEFSIRDRTITPDMVAEVLGPDTTFSITPTSLEARRQFEKLGIFAQYREGQVLTGDEVLARIDEASAPAIGP